MMEAAPRVDPIIDPIGALYEDAQDFALQAATSIFEIDPSLMLSNVDLREAMVVGAIEGGVRHMGMPDDVARLCGEVGREAFRSLITRLASPTPNDPVH
ncbi:hypothetical protein U0C82_18570 [Fulvimarina sp. 2208YS6-2-32]|uniref:Uncharacterized protein n=1 Tax=Fulvimarina uroteuthidis TaxID=3098149 RepID=A0ABU5I8B0_9HYPH|nr:hypothetical protein [Fulvimarina sp. 2208YS6-2-32]MDY8111129.1 hypothetical protein [Fulvimarina sp. 2208YS6-2-32]